MVTGMAPEYRSLHFSDQFAISCGAVTVDIERSKMLLICCRKTGEHMLPKGRKNVGEDLEETALRETFEETGMRAKLLPVRMKSLATSPAALEAESHETAITEPFAVSQRVAHDQGTLKIIFWYIAVADSTVAREENTQQEGEDFDVVWCGFDAIASTLTFDDDQRIAQTAVASAGPNSDPSQRSGCTAP